MFLFSACGEDPVENIIHTYQNGNKQVFVRFHPEENVLEKTEKFHQLMEDKKRNAEKKIVQMKEDALKEIKKISIKISIESVENILKNSIDKQKIENFNLKSLELAKKALKQTTT